jgi:hypothetical protein
MSTIMLANYALPCSCKSYPEPRVYNIVLNEAMTSNSGLMSLVLRDIYTKL